MVGLSGPGRVQRKPKALSGPERPTLPEESKTVRKLILRLADYEPWNRFLVRLFFTGRAVILMKVFVA